MGEPRRRSTQEQRQATTKTTTFAIDIIEESRSFINTVAASMQTAILPSP